MEYEDQIKNELAHWKSKMMKEPSLINAMSKRLQTSMNKIIPEKIHLAITAAIKQMTKGVLFGVGLTYPEIPQGIGLQVREHLVRERINFYRNAAAAEGIVTGAGGILLGLADFPLWLTLKMKMLFEIASIYGFNVRDVRERVYILHIFQLTFSSQKHRQYIFELMHDWENYSKTLPADINQFDWRNFQQEYRDYIDLAKLLQLVPLIGAAVGGVVNHRLTQRLGTNAMNAYRMRWNGLSKKLPLE
jgi:uncharacterized protein (DUF697 family)